MKNCSNKFNKLQSLEANITFPYVSEGEFSMHQLLEFLLTQTGAAKVHIASFSITEVAIRSFLNQIEKKYISDLTCIFDLSVRRHRLGLLYFMNNVVNLIALTKNHSKLILIENIRWKVTVISSANFNVNDKIEAGIISTEKRFYDFYLKQFNQWFDKGLLVTENEFN